MSNYQPLEVVNRSSETQPQVVEILNKLTQQVGFNIRVVEGLVHIKLLQIRLGFSILVVKCCRFISNHYK